MLDEHSWSPKHSGQFSSEEIRTIQIRKRKKPKQNNKLTNKRAPLWSYKSHFDKIVFYIDLWMFLLLQTLILFFFFSTKRVGLQVTSVEILNMSLFHREKEPYFCGNRWLTDHECLSPGVNYTTPFISILMMLARQCHAFFFFYEWGQF